MTASLVKPNDKIGILVAVAACAIFGVYPAASRAAYADGANAVFVVLVTTFFRAVILSLRCFWNKELFFDTPAHRKKALVGGFWLAVSITGIITSLFFIPGPLVLMIVSMRSLVLLFIQSYKKEVKLDLLSLVVTFVALFGLSFVLDLWREQDISDWKGIVLAFLACIGTVFQFRVYDGQMRDRSPVAVGAESFSIAFLFVLPLVFLSWPTPPQSFAGWGWSGLSALSLGLGVFGMFYGIALLGAFKWSLFAKTETIFTAFFSVLFLGEYLKLSQYGGIAVVIASLVVYQLLSGRKKEERR